MKYLISFLMLSSIVMSGCAASLPNTGYDRNAPSARNSHNAPQIKAPVSPPPGKTVLSKAVAVKASFSDTVLLDQF